MKRILKIETRVCLTGANNRFTDNIDKEAAAVPEVSTHKANKGDEHAAI
jgi:hypothetical protein